MYSEVSTKLINYLNLYKNNSLHGEFLLDLVHNTFYDKIFDDPKISVEIKKAIENFLAVNEMYDPIQAIRENEPYLTGDDKLINEAIKLQKIILGDNFKPPSQFSIPKSHMEEENREKFLISYTKLYQEKKLEPDDFVFVIFKLFTSYGGVYLNKFPLKIWWKLKKIKKLFNQKTYISLTTSDKETIIKTMLLLTK